ncbi:hypothetical protein GALMADRAFT_805836 [Galerina marginata CBS 339.88]|uniref:Uncharacterized protein n=1 Tax=Galerina marginata (strain CBS 339.88) TaxID=685588 RepID=A0A067SWH0_GALM3|nr:hypothetical protein GALMADRAFT_805836 [Galerina marginata CBS 339.88]
MIWKLAVSWNATLCGICSRVVIFIITATSNSQCRHQTDHRHCLDDMSKLLREMEPRLSLSINFDHVCRMFFVVFSAKTTGLKETPHGNEIRRGEHRLVL